jgi:3-mercaptopyruvate sulfurtransferase SseA
MKIILSILMISCLAVGLACQTAKMSDVDDKETSVGSDGANRITLAGAKKIFDAGNIFIVDTRAAAAYDSEHIKGAINMPLDAVDARWKEIPADKQVIAYCS